MRRLTLVRHGPTHAKTMIGWTDRPADLSDHGAIARLSTALPGGHIISSDLIRAVATADAVTLGHTRLAHDPGLREIHFGAWEDRRWADINDEDPDTIRAFWEQPGDRPAPGGESWNDLRRRVDHAVDRALGKTQGHLTVVCHFGAILTQLQRALGVPTIEIFGHTIDPLSLSDIVIGPDGTWRVDRINHQP